MTNVEVIHDSTEMCGTEGEINDFTSLFTNRLQDLRTFLEKNNGIRTRKCSVVSNSLDKEGLKIAGIVSNVFETKSDNLLIKLEDETGELPAVVSSKDEDLFEKAKTVLTDEVIALEGSTVAGNDLMFVDGIIRPDIPKNNSSKSNGYATFISDVHIGSKHCEREALNKFVDWLNGEVGTETHQKIGLNTDYLLVSGDLVAGIGVYPGQEQHLETKSLVEQYEEAAQLFSKIERDIEIIVSPGNHDATRLAEPQPRLKDQFKEALETKNTTLVSNPATVRLNGVDVLMYHGVSLNDIINETPSLTINEPTKAMNELLKRRHLAPIYGSNTPLAPEDKDHLIVRDVPDVMHSGHLHTYGNDTYNGVTMINSATWESQTDYQKQMNIYPDTGVVPLMNLRTKNVEQMRFV